MLDRKEWMKSKAGSMLFAACFILLAVVAFMWQEIFLSKVFAVFVISYGLEAVRSSWTVSRIVVAVGVIALLSPNLVVTWMMVSLGLFLRVWLHLAQGRRRA